MTDSQLEQVKQTLSTDRLSTYENAVNATKSSYYALDLYAWNAQISSAMLLPLHLVEVVIRNAVADALTQQYGEKWPWSAGFEQSLPAKGKYNPRSDLISVRQKFNSVGKIIPELKFVFWQKMFTSRFDQRLWQKYLATTFPNRLVKPTQLTNRQAIYNGLENIRVLRNRIAHHEPIFNRNLAQDFDLIAQLIHMRCLPTSIWMQQQQQVTLLLNTRP